MIVLYGPHSNGLHSACTKELITKLFEVVPNHFKEPMEIEEPDDLDFWDDDEKNAYIHGILRVGNTLHQIEVSYVNDYAKEFRTDPRVIELFKKYAHEGRYSLADVPDGMEWEVWTWDFGNESIHEKHRSWN